MHVCGLAKPDLRSQSYYAVLARCVTASVTVWLRETIVLYVCMHVCIITVSLYVCVSTIIMYVCGHYNLPPHTLESQKRDTNGFIAIQESFSIFADFSKNV